MAATARSAQPYTHPHAGGPAAADAQSKPKLYNPRHPERTLLYQTIAEHFETWHELASSGQFDGQGDHHTPKPYVRQAFRKYLECGIFAHGFARARCDDCGHDYFVAYSCKGRGVCPSCNTRRMVETAAHLTDHVFPRLPVRQWVLSVPKRLRYFMQRDGAVLNMVLRIFLRVIAQSLQTHSPGVAQVDKAALHIGAIAFIHRFGSSLNGHVHFHVCVVDGVFEAVAGVGGAAAQVQASSPGVIYHPATAIDQAAVAQVQTTLQKRILRAFVGRGLLESCDAKDMLAYQHSGFSVDAGVCIEAHDRAALERPPRTHRHRYFGVLAPNSPLRCAVTALAQVLPAQPVTAQAEPASTGACVGAFGVVQQGNALPTQTEPSKPVPPKRPAHYLWAVLIARVYEVFPLLCPMCGGQMRLIAFITHRADILQILNHIGVESDPPHIAPARGPPLWEGCDAQVGEGADVEPDWDIAAQPAPDYEVDQRINW